MRKKMNDKLALNRETLTRLDLSGVRGGGTTATTGESNSVYSCGTCAGPSCNGNNPTPTTGTSLCC